MGRPIRSRLAGADAATIGFISQGDFLGGSGLATLALGGAINYSDTYFVFQNVTTAGFTFSQITGYDTVDYQAQFVQDVPNNSYDLSFTAVPEPSSAACLLGGVGALCGWRRRRG